MRISIKDLERLAEQLNKETNAPMQPYSKEGANIGNFHISQAYGGCALHLISNKQGGVHDIFGYHMPKRELYDKIMGYMTLSHFTK